MPAKPNSLHADALTFVNTNRRRTLPAAPVDCGCASPSWACRHRGTLVAAPAACASAAPAAAITAAVTSATPSLFCTVYLLVEVPVHRGYDPGGGGSVTIPHRACQLWRHRRPQPPLRDGRRHDCELGVVRRTGRGQTPFGAVSTAA